MLNARKCYCGGDVCLGVVAGGDEGAEFFHGALFDLADALTAEAVGGIEVVGGGLDASEGGAGVVDAVVGEEDGAFGGFEFGEESAEFVVGGGEGGGECVSVCDCLLYTSPSPRD